MRNGVLGYGGNKIYRDQSSLHLTFPLPKPSFVFRAVLIFIAIGVNLVALRSVDDAEQWSNTVVVAEKDQNTGFLFHN